MTTSVLTGTQKRTFTIQNQLAERLNSYKNKSKIINNALNLYFEKEKYMEKAEKDFLDSFEVEYFTREEEDYITNLDSYKKLDKTIKKMNF